MQATHSNGLTLLDFDLEENTNYESPDYVTFLSFLFLSLH
jgi:hypothetical protein